MAEGSARRTSAMSQLRSNVAAELERYELLDWLSGRLYVSKTKCLLLLLCVFVGLYAAEVPISLMVDLVVFVYPAYASLVASVEEDKAERARWITYWVIMSFLTVFEGAFHQVLPQVLPFYFTFKTGFAAWCQSPDHKGSLFVYTHILAPFLKSHDAKLHK